MLSITLTFFFSLSVLSEESYEYDRYYDQYSELNERSHTPASDFEIPISDSEASVAGSELIKSVVTTGPNAVPAANTIEPNANPNTSKKPDPVPSINDPLEPATSEELPALPADILEALGDPKGKEEVFGPKIPEEIAKRWGRVLLDGLTKEQKQEILEKVLVPDNFRLAKAPLLNPEIMPVLSEPARNRDKLLEKSQNQLGLGISGLTNLASTMIEGKTDKIQMLKKLSEVSQIFLDLHYEDTKRRRKLITSSLDKKFLHMITDVKRDKLLFGDNLGDKIKASKTAERSGLQIKRIDATASTSRKYQQQGNWRGPPRGQAHRTFRQGGQRNRYPSQYNRRPPPAPQDRQPRPPPKLNTKTPK